MHELCEYHALTNSPDLQYGGTIYGNSYVIQSRNTEIVVNRVASYFSAFDRDFLDQPQASKMRKTSRNDAKKLKYVSEMPKANADRLLASGSRTVVNATSTVVENMGWRPNSVPIVKIDNASRDGFLERKTKRREKFVSDARKWCVGPMPVDEFLQAFFPTTQEGQRTIWKGKGKERMPTSRNAFRSVPKTPAGEQEISRSLVS